MRVSSSVTMMLVAGTSMTGCSTPDDRAESRPSATGGRITASIHGSRDAVDWRIDIVEKNGALCTRSVVQGVPRSFDCPPPVDDDIPLNFSIDGTDGRIDLVFGVAASRVTSLSATTKDKQRIRPELKSVGDLKFFAYSVKPGTALDLVAKDARGIEIASGRDKLAGSG